MAICETVRSATLATAWLLVSECVTAFMLIITQKQPNDNF